MTLYEAIYDFFLTHIFNDFEGYGELSSLYFKIGQIYSTDGIYEPFYVSMYEWLCKTGAIICTIIILVLCCLFVYKIIKLIGGLIR